MRHVMSLLIVTAAFAIASANPGYAEDKPLSPQQQKMKDCAVKWKDEKAKTSVRGPEAYRTFLSSCLKA